MLYFLYMQYPELSCLIMSGFVLMFISFNHPVIAVILAFLNVIYSKIYLTMEQMLMELNGLEDDTEEDLKDEKEKKDEN